MRPLDEVAVTKVRIHVVPFPADSYRELGVVREEALPSSDTKVLTGVLEDRSHEAIGRVVPIALLSPEQTERRQTPDSMTPFDGVEKRKNVVDRRTGLNRRVLDIGSPTGLERRRGPGRRRSDDRKAAEEGEMTNEQFEFVMAIETYKKVNRKMYPTWTEILEIVRQLGYRKVEHRDIQLDNVPEPELQKVA